MPSYGILGTDEIRSRLNEIFKRGTASEDCIDVASYNLRVAADGNFFAGKWHPIGESVDTIVINTGEMAVLSTIEEFTLPNDLSGSVNIKFRYTRRGLLSLFGSRVDPGFDKAHGGRRLYLFVCNIGSVSVHIDPGQPVFIVELSTVVGEVSIPQWPDVNLDIERFCKEKAASGERALAFLTPLITDLGKLKDAHEKIKTDVENLKTTRPLEQYLIFFAFVVLGVALLSQLAPIGLAALQHYLAVQPAKKAVLTASLESVVIASPVISVDPATVSIRRIPGDSHQANDILVVYRLTSGTVKSRISPSDLQYIGSLKVGGVGSETIQAVPIAPTSLKAIRVGDITFSARID